MDVGKSFTYMFEDKDWIVKILIGGAIIFLGAIFSWLLLIPLIAALAIVFGYMLATLRNVYEGNPQPLPKWENFGDLFMRGIKATIGLFVWSLPAVVLFVCAYVPMIMSGAMSNGDSGSTAAGLFGLIGACLMCVAFLVAIAISIFVYAPLTNFAITDQINTFWDFGGNWKFIQANLGNYVIAWLLGSIVAGFIASAIGSVTCGLLSFFASFWAMLVTAHLFGQYARAGAGTAPTDSGMLPPAPPPADEPPSMMQGPLDPAPSA